LHIHFFTKFSILQAMNRINTLIEKQGSEALTKRGGWEATLGFPKLHTSLTSCQVMDALLRLYKKYGEEGPVVILHQCSFILDPTEKYYMWRKKHLSMQTAFFIKT